MRTYARTEEAVVDHALGLAGGEEVGLVCQQHARDPPGDVVREELLPRVDSLEAVVICVYVWGRLIMRWSCMIPRPITFTHAPLAAADVEHEEDAGHLAEEQRVVARGSVQLRMGRVPEVEVNL